MAFSSLLSKFANKINALGTSFIETVYTITDGASVEINPSNGSIQVWVVTDNRTPAATTFLAGQSLTMMIRVASGKTITWTGLPVVWVGGTAPIFPTTGYGLICLWKVGTTIYGTSAGNVA
jgi:hypothetical protein